MNEEKLISIIIPVYNTAPYLDRCISSIRNQSYQNLEIICIDNNSTDESLRILKAFAEEDPRIVVLEEKKQGVSAARNMGIQNAHGSYITFVDSDDAIDAEMYSTLVDALEKEGADIAHCGYRRYAPDGSHRDISGTGEYLVEDKWEAIGHLLRGEKYIGSLANKVYKRHLINGLTMDESVTFNEDLLLNYELFSAAETAVFLDQPLYHYYYREESASSSNNTRKRHRDALSVSEKVFELFKGTPVEEAAANKYHYDLICLYRESIFEKKKASDEEMKQLQASVKELEASGIPLSRRNKMDFRFMRTCPPLYRGLYSIYNRIRKPNWDVKN